MAEAERQAFWASHVMGLGINKVMASHSEGERLGKRGRAYECNHCDYVGSASDTTWHITKAHLPLKDVPFHCRLCHYRAKDAKALVKHLETYKPHSKKCLAETIDLNS